MNDSSRHAPGPGSPRWGEVFAVIATAIAFQIAVHVLGLHAPFVVVASIGWIGYVALRVREDPRRLQRWGFGRARLRPALLATTAFAVLALVLLAVFAASRERLVVRPALLPTLLFYPIWGLVQQTLVQVFVARNLRRAQARTWAGAPERPSGAAPRGTVVAVCALLFALVHAPDLPLVVATGAMGAAFTAIYLRWSNLWPLGLWHGWLGAFFYAWALDRYPLVEMLP